jgi:hypothetical protein
MSERNTLPSITDRAYLCRLDQLTPTQLRAWARQWRTATDPVVRNLAAYALARAKWREALECGEDCAQWAALADAMYFALPLEYRW